jgi:hypothetical protein
MQNTFPQLTPEQLEVVAASGGLPVHLEDPETHKIYVLVERPEGRVLNDDYIRDQLSKGIAALEAGQRVSWDPERVKRDGRERLAQRKTPN